MSPAKMFGHSSVRSILAHLVNLVRLMRKSVHTPYSVKSSPPQKSQDGRLNKALPRPQGSGHHGPPPEACRESGPH